MLCIGNGQLMANSDHEEADTRIILHVMDSLERGSSKIMVRTVDTDVVVILIGQFHNIVDRYPNADIWIAFGTGKNFRYYNINTICAHLGKERSVAFLRFTLSQGVTLHLLFLAEPRRQHGLFGMFIQRSIRLFSSCLIMFMIKYITHRLFFFYWRDSLFYFMTKPVSLNLSMKLV